MCIAHVQSFTLKDVAVGDVVLVRGLESPAASGAVLARRLERLPPGTQVLIDSEEDRWQAHNPVHLRRCTGLRTIIGWLSATLLGAAGWWLGERLGLVAAVVLGALAGGYGLYAGHRWFDQNLR